MTTRVWKKGLVPKFGIILGDFRTEVQVMAELHLRYQWVQLTRRTNGAGNAMLIVKDDRLRILLADLKAINGRKNALSVLLETQSR